MKRRKTPGSGGWEKAKELKVDAATGGRSSINSDEQEGTKK